MGVKSQDRVNFGDELVSPEEKTRRVGGVFTSVARNYDLMNDLMSGGMHRLWKNRFVAKVKPRAGEHILDMAGGTGDIAFRMAGKGARVTVSDINADMLAIGMERAKKQGIDGLTWQVENAEKLSFAELKQRCAATIAYLRSIDPAALDSGAGREIVVNFPNGGGMRFDGLTYLNGFVLPNFYFHASMVYAILRAQGVELGKFDYLAHLAPNVFPPPAPVEA